MTVSFKKTSRNSLVDRSLPSARTARMMRRLPVRPSTALQYRNSKVSVSEGTPVCPCPAPSLCFSCCASESPELAVFARAAVRTAKSTSIVSNKKFKSNFHRDQRTGYRIEQLKAHPTRCQKSSAREKTELVVAMGISSPPLPPWPSSRCGSPSLLTADSAGEAGSTAALYFLRVVLREDCLKSVKVNAMPKRALTGPRISFVVCNRRMAASEAMSCSLEDARVVLLG